MDIMPRSGEPIVVQPLTDRRIRIIGHLNPDEFPASRDRDRLDEKRSGRHQYLTEQP